ncbi:olfactomedin-like protein 2B isoform X3 [Acanthopagrus latus]|uniref:olfactomedin-like protein 2B isoform X3 n=1 Tax=Acanthopagrus latus TaxID=8177 RepID=UPI00187C33CF|nr:olfactomedin-like protein 2B isoform X3 [Acanthopagrus latus]
MWRRLPLLFLCCALSGLDALEADKNADPAPAEAADPGKLDKEAPSAARAEDSQRGGQQPTAEPLEEEMDNQENIISQLLGDYDKVKTVSSGSDCVCRCVVRPIKRSDCSRIHESDLASASEHFYTVETITKGTDCKKCVCMAPPSAVNPCEGEYRFKKLQEASKDDIKLATIIDLLEGSLYGMDLLKLHSVTTKLLTRVDNMERAFAHNLTEIAREKERARERAKEKEKEKKAQQKKKKVNDLERAGQKSGAAAFANKQKNYDGQLKKNQQQDGLEQQQPPKNRTGTQKPIKDKNSVVIRGVTFYKAEEESYKEEEEEEEEEEGNGKSTTLTSKASMDADQLPASRTFPIKSTGLSSTISTELNSEDLSRTPNRPALIQPPTVSPIAAKKNPKPTRPAPIKPTTETTPTTANSPTIKLTTTQQTTTTTQPPVRVSQHSISVPGANKGPPIDASPTAESKSRPRSRLSWTESPADQPKATTKPVCKDTVASISEPVQQNSYGLSDGAWMRDARGHGNVIYLTNGHYGNNLLEFRDMDTFKSGQASNSYKLPYSFTGTGHVVFNGAFYYNRAFSRDIIRYDLRHRYVASWTTLHDAILEEQAHRTQTEVEFAVDESGLWLLYPALDTEGFHQEVILLIHLNHRDLQPIRTFRTGLRRGRYGNSFLVCGVLYGVDSMERHYANVTYAFDTHTLTHTVPSLAITNVHAHTSQLAYNPMDKKLYAWDDGHQMTYDVVFAY